MFAKSSFAALVAAVSVLASAIWQAAATGSAAAKAPEKVSANISKAEVWDTWPFQDTDEYLGHERCGEPIAQHKFEKDGWVNYHKMCVKVAVKARCGCTKLTTTYVKYEGESKWYHGNVTAEAEDIKCPVPIDPKVAAQCKAEVEAAKMCQSLVRVNIRPSDQSEDTKGVALKCPAGILPDYNGSPAYPEHCDICEPMSICDGGEAEEYAKAWKRGCKLLRKKYDGAVGYVLPNSPHRIYLKAAEKATPPAAGSKIGKADCAKFDLVHTDGNPDAAVDAFRALCQPPSNDDD